MKHVAIITNIPAPYRVDFFDYLQKNHTDYKFTIIYSSKNEDNRKWDIDEEKLNQSIFLESKTLKIKKRFDTKYIHFPVGVAKTLKKLKPDVVVGSEYNPTVIQAMQYCRRKGIPYVSWTDGTLFSERNINKMQRFLRKYVVKNADAYIASSTKSKEAQIAYGAEASKCHISFLAVDIEKYLQTPQGKGNGKILCVGSLIERKGVDLLLKALSKTVNPFELYLAGDGTEKKALRSLAKELGISEKVHFLGQLTREELVKHYGNSDLFVLPTREDCFALVILEAMCSGLPVICSKYADGAHDLILDGENGLVIDPYNEDQFAAAIDQILGDAELRKVMQKKSADKLEEFRFAKISQGYLASIEESMRMKK